MAVDFVSERIKHFNGTCQDEEGNNKSSGTEARSRKSKAHISVRNENDSQNNYIVICG